MYPGNAKLIYFIHPAIEGTYYIYKLFDVFCNVKMCNMVRSMTEMCGIIMFKLLRKRFTYTCIFFNTGQPIVMAKCIDMDFNGHNGDSWIMILK